MNLSNYKIKLVNLFKGRLNRRNLFYGCLLSVVVLLVVSQVIKIILNSEILSDATASLLIVGINTAVSLSTFIFLVSLVVRRLHDLGKSGFYILLLLIPIFDIFWLLYTFLKRGEESKTKYGEMPSKDVNFLQNTMNFNKYLSKEFMVALLLAIIAAVLIEYFKGSSSITNIRDVSKAVAVITTYDKDHKPFSKGSGIFIKSDGTLVTNYHVISGSNIPLTEAKLPTGAIYRLKGAGVLGTYPNVDIAILQFDAQDVPTVDLGDSDAVKRGQNVYAIGSPLGLKDLENSVTNGVISNHKTINGRDLLQFSAAISSGNSGGGLFTTSGKVIGITSSSIQIPPEFQRDESAQNLNFAVPSNEIKLALNGQEKIFTEGSSTYYYSLGTLADNSKDYDTAIEAYKKSIELDKTYADAYIGLGGVYYEKGQYDLEVENYKKAADLDQKSSNDRYLLATAYEDIGNYDLAVQSFKKALSIKPDDKDSLYELGILYIALGNKNEASLLLSQLTKVDPGLGKEIKLLLQK